MLKPSHIKAYLRGINLKDVDFLDEIQNSECLLSAYGINKFFSIYIILNSPLKFSRAVNLFKNIKHINVYYDWLDCLESFYEEDYMKLLMFSIVYNVNLDPKEKWSLILELKLIVKNLCKLHTQFINGLKYCYLNCIEHLNYQIPEELITTELREWASDNNELISSYATEILCDVSEARACNINSFYQTNIKLEIAL